MAPLHLAGFNIRQADASRRGQSQRTCIAREESGPSGSAVEFQRAKQGVRHSTRCPAAIPPRLQLPNPSFPKPHHGRRDFTRPLLTGSSSPNHFVKSERGDG
ncbi:uncharacterized protein THITE_2111559 [Thermothielavioides terrestris NRRL 8126]|uniref:Uncharacterized protein n=1 Tax=Thermothielavioides terrestris (strain ATCC 38088 / NRRL 8126) TaxID=578455 RepID=G2R2S4_THETT|nr:uncharacterized protein THITE_2111559 [Thermothielavioides terrestris NRRL 8126]AEO65035.1 hypothetical protein THITE_2111559 [Thermothielavioides terrestris NRRL 8126]